MRSLLNQFAQIFQSTEDDDFRGCLRQDKSLFQKQRYKNEKNVKTTLASLQIGVHGRYTVDKKKFMGYKFIKVRDTAETVIEENADDAECDGQPKT